MVKHVKHVNMSLRTSPNIAYHILATTLPKVLDNGEAKFYAFFYLKYFSEPNLNHIFISNLERIFFQL